MNVFANKNKKSIKTRLIKNFLVILLSTIIIVSGMFMLFISRYYYQNIEGILTSQIKMAAEFYKKYFSYVSLEDTVNEDIDTFWKQTNAQVQIYDENGNLIMDSLGVIPSSDVELLDVKKALKGQIVKWIGNVPYYDGKVMAISHPLENNKKIVGVIRYVSSMKNVDGFVFNFFLVFLIIGITVLTIGIFLSYFLANSIINPLKELTIVAEEMAKGNLKIRNNITTEDEIAKLAYALNFMADELEKREQLKNEFISSISHELRTPLTSIKGWAITLNNEFTDKNTLEMGFNIIEKESDRLSNMVEELLDFSKFVNGKITLKYQEIDLIQFINYIKTYMNPRAERENKNLNILCYIEENLIITGDRDRLNQVFINILDNSFKFTNEGGEIKIIIINNEDYINIIIKDNGCGITEDELPKVKEKFFKGKNSKSQNGIGLSICDEIVKLHGGTLQINSVLGKGTEVHINISKKIEDGRVK
ncbi:HAMP domain-containing sensor histidine kinase [Clostridium tarantellae]|uniref:histidine kinase n=1 Tax=Clostridium tarantellae TaxID=39493 RepID=A0A6I1MPV0_9CLOT|nr:HAMP domain-containing sensor histidine kinase [Clostridium tarantellae]MPQ44498.1 HAMP domain-containing protein [Clostridium tarantellae]